MSTEQTKRSEYKLHYFNLRARAEVCRLILACNNSPSVVFILRKKHRKNKTFAFEITLYFLFKRCTNLRSLLKN